MKVVIISKTTFTCTTIQNVSSISFASNTYTITAGGTTTTYSADNYNVSILW